MRVGMNASWLTRCIVSRSRRTVFGPGRFAARISSLRAFCCWVLRLVIDEGEEPPARDLCGNHTEHAIDASSISRCSERIKHMRLFRRSSLTLRA